MNSAEGGKQVEREFDPEHIGRYFDARDKNGDLYLASSNYEMDDGDERGTGWVAASDYDQLLALYRAASTPEAAALSDNGTNYVANRESGPTEVRFTNGRRVWVAHEDGKPYLEVSMMAPGEAWLRDTADAEDGAFVGVGMTAYNREVLAIMQARQGEAAALSEDLYSDSWRAWFHSVRPKMVEIMKMRAGVSMGELEEWTALAWAHMSPKLDAPTECRQCGYPNFAPPKPFCTAKGCKNAPLVASTEVATLDPSGEQAAALKRRETTDVEKQMQHDAGLIAALQKDVAQLREERESGDADAR